MALFDRSGDSGRLERELRALRNEPPDELVRALASRARGGQRGGVSQRRLALACVLGAALLAAMFSADVTGVTSSSAHGVVNVVKSLTGLDATRSLQDTPPGP